MKPGTPGFQPSRLIEAREARGLSAIALADHLGVTRQAVSQYETGKQSPHPAVMEKLVSVLRLPHFFFTSTPTRPNGSPVFFRSLASATAREQARARVLLSWVGQLAELLETHLELPATNLPDFSGLGDPTSLRDEDIERAATETRRFWKMGDGPISNVAWLLENNGVVVARLDLGADRLDGLSQWNGTRATMVLSADKGTCARSRFDAAHELAHVLLHRGVDAKRAAEFETHRLLERQAHRFAGAFLLPEASFSREATAMSLDGFRGMKGRWKVAISMMVTRARNLGYINDADQRRLMIGMSRRQWRKQEPLDSELTPEQPRLLRRAMELAIESHGRDFLSNAPLLPDDVALLTGTPLQVLTGDTAQLVRLIQRRDEGSRPAANSAPPAPVFPIRGRE